MSADEANIQKQIMLRSRHNVFLPNIYISGDGLIEVDLLEITPANYCTIYEIKVSRSDFLADLKKYRHKVMTEAPASMPIKPKHFIYVIEGFDLAPAEVPEYAGCWQMRGFYLKTIKDPPDLWRRKLTAEQRDFLYRKIAKRYFDLRQRLTNANFTP